MSQDIENLIPTAHIVKQNDCLRVSNKRKRDDYEETNIELIKIFRSISNNPVSYQNNNIYHAVCLAIEDIKRSKYDQNCWKFHKIAYRNVLIYGRVSVLNECSRENKNFYTLSIDDETESIDGYLNKNNSKYDSTDKHRSEFCKTKSILERRKGVGINLEGKFYAPDSAECKETVNNLKMLECMIENNLKKNEKNFSLGPMKEKALIYAMPSLRNDTIKLNIFNITLDDTLDLSWKRNINKLYSDVYFK